MFYLHLIRDDECTWTKFSFNFNFECGWWRRTSQHLP